IASATGGLSGPAIRPVAIAMVHKVARALDVPIIGCGGVTALNDVLEFLIAGASAVQIGTATYTDPATAERIVAELEGWCASNGVKEVREVVGSLDLGTPEGDAAG